METSCSHGHQRTVIGKFCSLEKFVRGKRRKSSGKQGDQFFSRKFPFLMTDEILYRHFGLHNTSRTEKELKAHNRNWSRHIHRTPTLSKSRTWGEFKMARRKIRGRRAEENERTKERTNERVWAQFQTLCTKHKIHEIKRTSLAPKKGPHSVCLFVCLCCD